MNKNEINRRIACNLFSYKHLLLWGPYIWPLTDWNLLVISFKEYRVNWIAVCFINNSLGHSFSITCVANEKFKLSTFFFFPFDLIVDPSRFIYLSFQICMLYLTYFVVRFCTHYLKCWKLFMTYARARNVCCTTWLQNRSRWDQYRYKNIRTHSFRRSCVTSFGIHFISDFWHARW